MTQTAFWSQPVRAIVGAEWGWEAVRRAEVQACDQVVLPFTGHLLFFVNWSRHVPEPILSRNCCINFHCSALPLFRGGHPIENQILAGLTETVITAHQMTTEYDAGPIYGTRGPVSLTGSKAAIQARFVEPVADLMRWIIETQPTPVPQQGEPTYCRRLSPEAYAAVWEGRA